jgi:hypothetical protein
LLLAPDFAQAASCYIREYKTISTINVQTAQIAPEPGFDQTPIPLSGTSTPSSSFQASTHVVRLFCGASASFVFGQSPTATTSSAPIAGAAPEYFAVIPGQAVAFISNASP